MRLLVRVPGHLSRQRKLCAWGMQRRGPEWLRGEWKGGDRRVVGATEIEWERVAVGGAAWAAAGCAQRNTASDDGDGQMATLKN